MWFAERSGRPEAWFQAAVTLRESILRDWVTLSDQFLALRVPVDEDPTFLYPRKVRMSAHALADDGDGETPVIPPTLMTAGATAAGAGTADPAEQLSRRLLEMATSAGDPAHQALLSPRLLEALLWAVSRWADTYLMPEDSGGSLHHFTQQAGCLLEVGGSELGALAGSPGPLSVAITRAFGEASGGGAAALAILVQAVVAALLYWPGEIQLQTEATSTLLPILTRRRALCRHLINLESWQQLAVAGAGSFSARCTGFQLMAAVVSEFAPGSAGAMAMPFEFHEQCRAEFEMQYLQHIFVKTVEQTRQVVATGAAQQGTDEGVCAAGLTLCNAILSWDFQRGGGAGASGAIGYIPVYSLLGSLTCECLQVYSLLGNLTCECLQAGALSSLAEDTAVAEALSMLLEAWAALLQGPQRRGWGQSVEQQIPAGILQAAQQTFAQGALATASQEAFQDEGGEDATGSAGAKPPWHATSSLAPSLARHLLRRTELDPAPLHLCGGFIYHPPSSTLGDSKLLVDTAKTSQTESAVEGSPEEALPRQVNPGAHWRDVLLAPEAADWALGLQESLRGTTSPLLSSTRQMIIQLASLGVGIFPEGDQGAYAQQDPRLLALAPPQHRGLLHSLGQAALGFSDAAQTEAYIVALLKPMLEELRRLVGSSDRDQIGQRPETEQMLMRVLEALRGILKATHPRFQPVVFRFVHEMMPGLLEVQKLVRRNPMVTLLLLKAVRAFTEMHATLLECITPDQMHTLARFCLGLVTQYSQDLAGSHQVAGAIESQERYKQLLTLLKLLTDLTDRDLQSLAPAPVTGSADSADVAQVVLLGLHLVIPLISPELLKFPKLCRQYFTLLSVLLAGEDGIVWCGHDVQPGKTGSFGVGTMTDGAIAPAAVLINAGFGFSGTSPSIDAGTRSTR
eukprot:gene18543-22136_t